MTLLLHRLILAASLGATFAAVHALAALVRHYARRVRSRRGRSLAGIVAGGVPEMRRRDDAGRAER